MEDYLYDERNRLTQKSSTNPDLQEAAPEAITTYQYDLQGSLTKEQSADFCKQYLYNDFHQCIQTDVIRGREADAERLVQQNLYDGEGLRFAIIENGNRTGFITDGWDNVTELDGNGRVRKRIIRGLGIVASEDTEESADTANVFTASYHYYHGNERMDVEHITDEAGSVRNSYAYDAFGGIISSKETIQNRYTYNGEAYDKTTEQYYLRKRFYNPRLCRFTQEDEYRGDGLNLYAFCANNPVMYVDPSGYGSVTYTDRPIVVDGNEIGSTNYKTGEYLKILIDEEYLPNSNISQTVVSDETSNQVYKDFYQSDSKVRGKTIENTVASANRSDYIQIGNAFNDKYPIIDLVNESSVVSIKSLNQFCSTYKTDNIPDVDKVADKVMQYYSDIDNINISVNGKNNITKELLVALHGKNNDFKMEVQEEVNKRIEQKYESGDTGASKNSKTKCRIV